MEPQGMGHYLLKDIMTFLVPVGSKPAALTVALSAVTLFPVAAVAFMYAVFSNPRWWK